MRGGRDLGRADRQAQALKPPIVTKLQRMTEHQAQLALKSRSVAQVLAFGLAVEHQGPADQAEAGQGQAEPDTTTWTGCFPPFRTPFKPACGHPGVNGAGRGRNIEAISVFERPMPADPLLLTAGQWLGVASAVLAVLTVVAFVLRWGIRFRLVGVTSFTVLLAISCAAFAISYSPRVSIPGAVVLPVVYDNGAELVVAAAPEDLAETAILPSLEQISRNLRGSGRQTEDGLVHVRLRQIRSLEAGRSQPIVLAEATRNLADGSVQLPVRPAAPGR